MDLEEKLNNTDYSKLPLADLLSDVKILMSKGYGQMAVSAVFNYLVNKGIKIEWSRVNMFFDANAYGNINEMVFINKLEESIIKQLK